MNQLDQPTVSVNRERSIQVREEQTKIRSAFATSAVTNTAVGGAVLGPTGAIGALAATTAVYTVPKVIENPLFMRNGITNSIYQMFLGKGLAERLNNYIKSREGDINSEPLAKGIVRLFDIVEKGGSILSRILGTPSAAGYLGAQGIINSTKSREKEKTSRAVRSENIGNPDEQQTNVDTNALAADIHNANNNLQGALEQ